jgi:hypothetical protein
MTQMDQVTQSNATQTEQLSSTAQALSEQSLHLIELVGTFVLSKNATRSHALPAERRRAPVRPPLVVKPKPRAEIRAVVRARSNSVAPAVRPRGHPQTALAVAAGDDHDASFEESSREEAQSSFLFPLTTNEQPSGRAWAQFTPSTALFFCFAPHCAIWRHG